MAQKKVKVIPHNPGERLAAFKLQAPAPQQGLVCKTCAWQGQLGDCQEIELGCTELTGGWVWLCPRCDGGLERFCYRLVSLEEA
jgi:hypothetical protein